MWEQGWLYLTIVVSSMVGTYIADFTLCGTVHKLMPNVCLIDV